MARQGVFHNWLWQATKLCAIAHLWGRRLFSAEQSSQKNNTKKKERRKFKLELMRIIEAGPDSNEFHRELACHGDYACRRLLSTLGPIIAMKLIEIIPVARKSIFRVRPTVLVASLPPILVSSSSHTVIKEISSTLCYALCSPAPNGSEKALFSDAVFSLVRCRHENLLR